MKESLLLYPVEWKNLLNLFTPDFSKPQFNNFCQSTTCMAISAYSSIKRWANVFDKKNQSSLNDFFTISPWDDGLVHTRLSRITVKKVKDANIGIIDDTLSHKPYAKKMAFLDFFYDGLTKKKKKGHSVVTHGLHSQELGFVPFDNELYKKDGRSKNDIACEMIERTQRFKKLPLWLVDSWYSNEKVIGKIRKAGSHFITEIKSNRNIHIGRRNMWVREHEKTIPKKLYTQVKIKDSLYRYFQTSGFISGIGNVNLVFSQKYEESEKNWSETYYITTDILSMKGDRVIELYLLRGGIEGFHRQWKQDIGMESYQLRNDRGIERYLFLAMLVFALLLLLNQRQMRRTFESKTIGELCRELKAECHTTLLLNAKHIEEDKLIDAGRELAYAL
jgi:hypothetical protein